MELQFRVTKQSIKRTDGQTPVSDSVNYLTAEFTFDSSDWDNTTKTATFRSGVSVYTVILDSNNKCLVPWELIRAGKLKVSVYGDGANEYRITADSIDVPVYASGFSLGEESQHPTPDQYEQLTGALAEKVGVDNLKTINGQSLIGTGDIIIEGGGASIDDVTATTYTVYSSEKVALMVSAKPSINDEEASTASVYSSAETDLLLASKLDTDGVKTINGESIVGDGNITIEGGGAEINDTTASTASVYSSEKTVGLVNAKPSIDDVTASTTSVYSSKNVLGKIATSDLQGKMPNLITSANDELSYKPDTTNYILLYVDDARTDLPDIWAIAQEYNIPLNLAVPSEHLSYICNNGKKMNVLLHEMEDAGCEILSHARTESDILTANSTRAQAYAWLKESKEALLAEGYKVNGFVEPGGEARVSYDSKDFGDLIRMFYAYSDTNVYPSGINKTRTSLYTQGVTIDSLLKSVKRGQNARKFFCHAIGGDVTEAYLREFIETALAGNYVFTTEYEFYQAHAYSILDDRLKRLEKNLGKYNSLDAYLFHKGWNRPSYDESTYPYALVIGSGDYRMWVSDAPLIKDLTNSYIYFKKSDGTSFNYRRYLYASGAWTMEKNESVTSVNTGLAKTVNPASANYDVYDSNGTLVRAVSDYYSY